MTPITFEPPSFARKVMSPLEVDCVIFEVGVSRALDSYDLAEPREVYEESARLYFDRGHVNERLKSNRIKHREDALEYAGFDYAIEMIQHPSAILRPEDDAPESQ